MATRRKCPKCGKETRTQGAFCPNCGNELTPVSAATITPPIPPVPPEPEPVPEPEPEPNGGSFMKNYFGWLVIIALAVALAVLGYAYFDEQNDKIVETQEQNVEMQEQIDKLMSATPAPAEETNTDSTDSTATTYVDADGVTVLTVAANGVWQGDEMYWLVEDHTGTNITKGYRIIVPKGFVAVIECNGLNGEYGGHLIAYSGGQTIEKTVFNGFVGICTAKAAKDLFTERWNVLESNNWDRKDIRPLKSWGWKK